MDPRVRFPWLLLGVAACSFDVAPSVTIEVEPEPVARGRYRAPDIFEVQGAGTRIMALADEYDLLVVIDPESRARCELPNVASAVALARYDPASRGLALTEQLAPTRILSFSDIDCAPPTGRIEDVWTYLPLVSVGGTRTLAGVSVLSVDGELTWHDPHQGGQRPLASGVLSFRTVGGRLWLIEDGVLTVRTYDGELVTSMGQGVVQFSVGGGGDRVAWRDSTGLHYLEGFNADVIDLTGDGCEPNLGLSGAMAYYAPCATRRLVLRSLGSGNETVVGEGISSYRVSGSRIYWVSDGPSASVGELYVKVGNAEPKHVASDVDINSIRGRSETESFLIRGWDGSRGTLAIWNHTDNRVTDIIDGVYRFSTVYGASDVQVLVMRNFEDGVGTVELRDGADFAVRMQTSGVHPSWFRASGYLTGLAFLLSDWDPERGTGTLEVWDTLVLRTWEVMQGVALYRESRSPTYGILINAPDAEEPGLWYAIIDVQGGFSLPF